MELHSEIDSDSDDQAIPDHLVCPITSEMMSDPVIAEDGHTYERTALINWIAKNPTSPMTREPIGKMVIPNRGIKKAIEEYKNRPAQKPVQAPIDLEPLRQGLITSYQAQAHIHRIDDEVTPLPIEKCFINLEIIRETEQKREELMEIEQASESSAHLLTSKKDAEPAKDNREAIEIANLLPDNDKRSNKVMIYGRAGSGKSTLFRYIATQWSHGKLWHDRFDWLIWIPLRTLTDKNYPDKKKNIGAIDLIVSSCIEHHDQRGLVKTSEDLKNALRDKLASITDRTLILLDGFDELDWPSVSYLHNAFYQLMNFPYVCVSSRPNYRIENVSMDSHLEITGFKPKEIRSFVQLFFEGDPIAATQCVKSLMSNDKLWGIAQIPINIELLCSVFRNNKLTTDQLSLTMVYQHLEFWLLQRAIQRQGKFVPQANTPTLYFAKELQLLRELAFRAMCAGKVLIPPELLSECKSYDEVTMESARRLGFFKVLKEGLFFIHLTFQEYFAGSYVATTPLVEIQASIGSRKYLPRLELMWWFAAGCLRKNQQSLSALLAVLETEPHDLVGIQSLYLLVGCLEEAQVPDLGVTKRVSKQLEKIFQTVTSRTELKLDHVLSTERYSQLFKLAGKLIQQNANKFEDVWLNAWLDVKEGDKERMDYLFEIVRSSGLITPKILTFIFRSNILQYAENYLEELVVTEQHLPTLKAMAYSDDSSTVVNTCVAIYKIVEYHLLKSDQDLPTDFVQFLSKPAALARASLILAIKNFAKPTAQILSLLNQALNDKDPKVLVESLSSLKQFQVLEGSSVNKTLKLLDCKDYDVKNAAVEALAILPRATPAIEQGLLQLLNDDKFSATNYVSETLRKLKVSDEIIQTALLQAIKNKGNLRKKERAIDALGSFTPIMDSVYEDLLSCLPIAEVSLNSRIINLLRKNARPNPGAKSDQVVVDFRRFIETAMTTINTSVMVEALGIIRPVSPETITCLKSCIEHKPYPVALAALRALLDIGVSVDELTEQFLKKLSEETYSSLQIMKVLIECDHLPKPLLERIHQLIRQYPTKSYVLRDALNIVLKFDQIESSLNSLLDVLDPDVKALKGDSETEQIIFNAILQSEIKNPERIVTMLSKRLINESDKPFGKLISQVFTKLKYQTPATVPALIKKLLEECPTFHFCHKHETVEALGKLGRNDNRVVDALHEFLDKCEIGDNGPHGMDEYILNAFIDLQIATPKLISGYVQALKNGKYTKTMRTIITGFQGLLPLYELKPDTLVVYAQAIASTCTSCTLSTDGHGQAILGNRMIEFSCPPELVKPLQTAIYQAMSQQGISLENLSLAQSQMQFFRARPNESESPKSKQGANKNAF